MAEEFCGDLKKYVPLGIKFQYRDMQAQRDYLYLA